MKDHMTTSNQAEPANPKLGNGIIDEGRVKNSNFLAMSSTYRDMRITNPLNAQALKIGVEKRNNAHQMSSITEEPILSSNLVSKLVGDIAVACFVTLGVSPFMTTVDKAIVQRAAGTHTISQSCVESLTSIFRNPVGYVKSPMFLMMWAVYASTYTTANCLKTISEHKDHFRNKSDLNSRESPRQAKTHNSNQSFDKMGIFCGTTIVNSGTTMVKDRFYATMFGASSGTAGKVPFITYGLWGVRDCLVIGSSFILPDIMSGVIEENTSMDKANSLRFSQLACPIATQLVAGPIQLLGLDFYNRPLHHLSYSDAALERLKLQSSRFFSIVGARISRIAPAYGIGGIGNTYFRDSWRETLLHREVSRQMKANSEGEGKEGATRLVELVLDNHQEAQDSSNLRRYTSHG